LEKLNELLTYAMMLDSLIRVCTVYDNAGSITVSAKAATSVCVAKLS